MKRIAQKVVVAALLVVGIMATALSVFAKNEVLIAQTPIEEILAKPVEALNDSDLKSFVILAHQEEISVAQAEKFFQKIETESQVFERVSILVAETGGVDIDEWQRERAKYKAINEGKNPTDLDNKHSDYSRYSNNPSLWRQPIENRATFWSHEPYASFYYRDDHCEHDFWYQPDEDWVFYFEMNYSSNPDGLRWTTDSSWVYSVFHGAYGGDLNSFAHSFNHVKICIGGSAASAAGKDHIKNTVFLTPNN